MTVRVRMYRQGLGDCFLLSFDKKGNTKDKHHILIDCGVIVGQSDEKLVAAVDDIKKECGKNLDVVVATHEHWDHISGFTKGQARGKFDEMSFGEVWFAWTEDDKDKQARALKKEAGVRLAGLRKALEVGAALGLSKSPSLQLTDSLLGFFGPGAAGDNSTAGAREYLIERGKEAGTRFLEPGKHFALPGVEGVRVYVLGPPRDEVFLRKDLPSKKQPETYHDEGFSPSVASSFFATVDAAAARLAAGDAASASELDAELMFPFDRYYRVAMDAAKDHAFFQQRYGFEEKGKDAWRRIDDDWLRVAGELALDLDSDTNNTSLVLAFELEPEGRVLLFAADAQVGNWLSWEKVRFDVRTPARRIVTAKDLLARTVLYKVGHHASHNATLAKLGLELMTNEDLVALIPVDEEMAKKKGKGWNMPFPPLLTRLEERCRGRVIRIDKGKPGADDLRQLGGSERDAFARQVDQRQLYIDVTF